MDTRTVLQIVNVLISGLAIPPAFFLLQIILRESKEITPEKRALNRALTALFFGVGTGAFINFVLSLLVLMGDGAVVHNISPFRTFLINVMFSITSWSIYFVHLKTKETK